MVKGFEEARKAILAHKAYIVADASCAPRETLDRLWAEWEVAHEAAKRARES